MQMSGRSSECVSVRFCGCEFKTLRVAERFMLGPANKLHLKNKPLLSTFRRGHAHMHAQIKRTISLVNQWVRLLCPKEPLIPSPVSRAYFPKPPLSP